MKQLIYIGGWDCFRNDDDFSDALKNLRTYEPFKESTSWKSWLQQQLVGSYEIATPIMPNRFNARYKFRKIWFEKILPHLNNEDLVMIWYSLGGIFLAKYLSENTLPWEKKIAQLHLVAAVFDESDRYSQKSYLADFAFDSARLKHLEQQVDKIYLYHSKDDPSVPFSHVEKFKQYLPHAIVNTFEDRGHFFQTEFPELLANILK